VYTHTDVAAVLPFLLLLAAADDPRRVVIQGLEVVFKDAPTITYSNLNTVAAVQQLKTDTAENPIQFVEGCFYKIKVIFKVQHEIVSGLRYVNKVSRGPVAGTRQHSFVLPWLGSAILTPAAVAPTSDDAEGDARQLRPAARGAHCRLPSP